MSNSLCKISGFHHNADEIFTLLGCSMMYMALHEYFGTASRTQHQRSKCQGTCWPFKIGIKCWLQTYSTLPRTAKISGTFWSESRFFSARQVTHQQYWLVLIPSIYFVVSLIAGATFLSNKWTTVSWQSLDMQKHKHTHQTQLFVSWTHFNAQTHQNIDIQLPALSARKNT